MPNLKKGDVVHVRAVMESSTPCRDGDVSVYIQSTCGRVRREVAPAAVVHVESRAPQVGDEVFGPATTLKLRVNAILGDYAWTCTTDVVPGSARGNIHPLASLERAEPSKPRTRRDQLAEAYPRLIDRIEEAVKEQHRLSDLDEPAEECAGEALNSVMTFSYTREGHDFWAAQAKQHGWLF